MKIFKLLLLLVLSFSLWSCNEHDDEVIKADFSVLGVTTVSINNKPYSVKEGMLLEVEEDELIALVGFESTQSTARLMIEYAVITSADEPFIVTAESAYSDVSITIDTEVDDDKIHCVVQFSREGYQEQLSYEFYAISALPEVE
ncbi:hypothetical protein ACRTDU_14545 [Sunxiuqinia elliptica]